MIKLSAGILLFLCLVSCPAQESRNDFYRGLKAEPENPAEAAEYYIKALDDSNIYTRQAAANRLAELMYGGMEFSSAAIQRIRKEAAGPWAEAFDAGFASGQAPSKEKILDFLLNSGISPEENAFQSVLLMCGGFEEGFFTWEESAVIGGHIAARSGYNEALVFFRAALENASGAAVASNTIPELFRRYPDLITDLGRSFQYTDSGNEGLELFVQWAQSLDKNIEENNLARFRLLFYAARIARQRGGAEQAIALFKAALPLAPAFEQLDACIWYILDSSLNRGAELCIIELEKYAPYWTDHSYFDDVLGNLSRQLLLNRDWKGFLRVLAVLQNINSAYTAAQYSWIIARAIEEGYLSEGEITLAREVLNNFAVHIEAGDVGSAAELSVPTAGLSEAELVAAFFRMAYNNGGLSYYRVMSAKKLSEPVLNAPVQDEGSQAAGPAQEFLIGFFNNDAARFARGYIRALEKELSAEDIAVLAKALAADGQINESMRLVTMYGGDTELMYPRAFKELIEKYAEECGFSPSLLFALIRTESAFQSDVASRVGAVGLTQLMLPTAEEMAGRIRRGGGPDYFKPDEQGKASLNLTDPEQNIHIGAYYLAYLMNRFEDIFLALLSYNGGMNRVRRWRAASVLPVDLFLETVEFSETREYGRLVIAAEAVYRELYYK